MNRHNKGRSSHMPEKMESQRDKKRRVANDEDKTHLDEMCHHPKLHCQNQCCSKDGNTSAMVDVSVTHEKQSKDEPTQGKATAKITYNEEDSSRITRTQPSTSPSVLRKLNKKDQAKKTISRAVIQRKHVFLRSTRMLSLHLRRMTQPNRTKEMFTRSHRCLVKRSHVCHLSSHQRGALTVHLKTKLSLREMAKGKEKVTTVSLRRTTKSLR